MAQKKTYSFGFLKNGWEAGEWMKCKQSPIYFIRTYVKIDHPMLGLIPFALFIFQEALLSIFVKHRKTIILKPRQMGITTIAVAYVLWLCMFHPYKNVVLISIKFATAKGMLRKLKTMYRNLPDFLKEPVTNGSSPDEVGSAHEVIFANGSTIKAVASSADAARSEAASLIVMDEAAFIAQASGIWASVQPTMSTGGSAIILSSAFGMGNFFHQEWTRAIQGLGLFPVKLHWRMRPERDENWLREQRLELGEKRCKQEVECDFLRSGYNVFNMDAIKAIETRLFDKIAIKREHHGYEGEYVQYHHYDPSHIYYIGADISTGRSRDFSAFSIMDEAGKEYACFKGKISPRELALLTMSKGEEYGWAVLAPEVNAIGEGVIAIYQEYGYPNVYNSVSKVLRLNEWKHREADIMGWLTTGKSRNTMIAGMEEDLDNELIELNNPFFVQEAFTFIYDSNNRPVAMGKHGGGRQASAGDELYDDDSKIYVDDAIVGGCITNEVRKDPRKFGDVVMMGGFG